MVPISYDKAYESSLEYFSGDELAATTFLNKYALRNEDGCLLEGTPRDMHLRMARKIMELQEARKSKYKSYRVVSLDDIMQALDGFRRIVPQGSIMFGLGNPYQYVSLSNCFVVQSPYDSYGSIMRADEELVQISKRRGGVGLDISYIRPVNTPTRNAARLSTGIVPFMERFSNSIREVGQEGRRGALMITISVHHPQVLDFALAKVDLTKVTGANVSIRLSDEFMRAVENDGEIELFWEEVQARKGLGGDGESIGRVNRHVAGKARARQIWEVIVTAARNTAEPGLLFWDRILEESPADCYADFGFRTISTNPCSEIPLCAYDSCRLLLLNLYSFVKDPFTNHARFDYGEFERDVRLAVRIMDVIIDGEIECIQRVLAKVRSDPEPKSEKVREIRLWKRILERCEQGRRTGIGVTALGDCLAALGFAYGSDRARAEVDSIFRTLKLACYGESVALASETSPFPIWNPSLESGCVFFDRLRDECPELWKAMSKKGRRNIAMLTVAPAGTVSILTQTTSGIEPLFATHYVRRRKISPNDRTSRVDFVDAKGDRWQEFTVFHPKVLEWQRITGEEDLSKSPWAGSLAEELNWTERVAVQGTAQRHVDHGISSTLNLPEDITVEEVANIYFAAWKAGCKGITVYRKGSRSGVLVSPELSDKNKKVSGIVQAAEDGDSDGRGRGGDGGGGGDGKRLDIGEGSDDYTGDVGICKTKAPKRPKVLPGVYKSFQAKSRKNGKPTSDNYLVFVGLYGGDPYEVFVCGNFLKRRMSGECQIKKMKRGSYAAYGPDGSKIGDISKHCTGNQEALGRLASLALRHGSHISFVVDQLERVQGSFRLLGRALARALKSLAEGSVVAGMECPNCGQSLIRRDGCPTCMHCGWTKCV